MRRMTSILIFRSFRTRYLRWLITPASFPGGDDYIKESWSRSDVKGLSRTGTKYPLHPGWAKISSIFTPGRGRILPGEVWLFGWLDEQVQWFRLFWSIRTESVRVGSFILTWLGRLKGTRVVKDVMQASSNVFLRRSKGRNSSLNWEIWFKRNKVEVTRYATIKNVFSKSKVLASWFEDG